MLAKNIVCSKMVNCEQYNIQTSSPCSPITNVSMCCAVQCSAGDWLLSRSNGHVVSFHPRVPGVLFLVLVLVLFLFLSLFLFLVLLFSSCFYYRTRYIAHSHARSLSWAAMELVSSFGFKVDATPLNSVSVHTPPPAPAGGAGFGSALALSGSGTSALAVTLASAASARLTLPGTSWAASV